MATAAVGSSGLDVNSIVSQLMTLERRPLQVLAQREAQVTARIAAFSRVQGGVSSLQTAAATLAKASSFAGLRASVAGDGAGAAVTDSSKAVPGAYSLKITALAASQALASQAMVATDAVGTGSLTIELGSLDGGVFTPKAGAAATPITIDAGNNTLAGIRDAINAAKLGVTASLVNDNSGTRLTVVGSETGLANTVRITVADTSDASDTDNAGLSRLAFDPAVVLGVGETTAAGRQMLQTRAAADARFEVNGLALTSSSNRITGAIDGATLDLRRAAADSVTTISIERDTAAIRNAVDAFIKAYNDVENVISEVTAYDPANRRAAVLNGDSVTRSVQGQLRALLRSQMTAGAGDFANLSAAGIEIRRDGTLGLNSARFDAALADPLKLGRLFSSTGDTEPARGFGVRFEALAKSIAEADGMLPARTKSLQSQVDAMSRQEERLNARLEQTEQRLRRQYSALDVQLQRMQGTSDSLANALTRLPGANNG